MSLSFPLEPTAKLDTLKKPHSPQTTSLLDAPRCCGDVEARIQGAISELVLAVPCFKGGYDKPPFAFSCPGKEQKHMLSVVIDSPSQEGGTHS